MRKSWALFGNAARRTPDEVDAIKPQRISYFAGIIGDKPSRYSKSPAIWNAAFRKIRLDAAYLPFDVDAAYLKPLLKKLTSQPGFLGLNVTVPHKERVIPLLGSLSPDAKRIGAVNVIVRDSKGRLVGYNTDGGGAVDSLIKTLPGQKKSFLQSLSGKKVLLLGAGGSARAVSFALAKELGQKGQLYISNRTWKNATTLGKAVRKIHRGCFILKKEKDLETILPETDLIINATTKGQSSMKWENYSALGPRSTKVSLKENLEISKKRIRTLKPGVKLFDLIYAPAETVFLKQGRAAGLATLNGRNMILWQAAASFSILMKSRGWKQYSTLKMEKKILNAMSLAW